MGERDYHFGVAPQGLLALRLILGDKAMFDLTGRAYYVSGVGGEDPGGRETVYRLNSGFTVRIYGHHALGIQYVASIRDAHYPDRASSHQTDGTVSLVYTLLGDTLTAADLCRWLRNGSFASGCWTGIAVYVFAVLLHHKNAIARLPRI